MTSSGANRLRIAGLALALVVGVSALVASRQAPPSLFSRASRVAELDYDSDLRGFWLPDDRELLVGREYDTGARQAIVLDRRTRTSAALPRFSSQFGRSLTDRGSALSPDGKWLLWEDDRTGGSVAATLDAAQVRRWSERRTRNDYLVAPVWLPDSRHFIEVRLPVGGSSPSVRALLRSLDAPSESRELPLPNITDVSPLGTTRDGRSLLLVSTADQGVSPVPLTECDLDARSAVCRESRVALPNLMWWWEVALSPRGDRLAWVVAMNRSLPKSRFPLSLARSTNGRADRNVGIYVTDLHGRVFQCVGTMSLDGEPPLVNPTRFNWDHRPSALQWLPDGRRLSFNYKHTIFTVPAP